MSNIDIKYSFNDQLPGFLRWVERTRTVYIDTDDEAFLGTSEVVVITASYGDVTTDISFNVSFLAQAKAKEPKEPAKDADEDPEPETEESEPEETTKEKAVTQATDWDGWKELLNEYSPLPEGVTLPPPNDDPSYVPTPPKAVLAKITARGTSEV